MTRQSPDPHILGRFVPLNGLPTEHLAELATHAELLYLDEGEKVPVRESFPERTLYLVEGEVEILADGKRVNLIKGGSDAARFSLAHVAAEKRTARARSAVTLIRFERARISTMLVWSGTPGGHAGAPGPHSATVVAALPSSLLRSELFTRIPPPNVQRIFTLMETVNARAGEAIVRQGDPGDYYYVVRDGRCAVTHRPSPDSEPIELAVLSAGDSFGEEALVSGARRNATVSMLSDGVLLRLTKEDFVELIRDPLLGVVPRTRAEDLVRLGAHWLDIRLPEEHANHAIPGSLNIPLSELRDRADELDHAATWVVYCNTGRRSSAAAFLLIERGIKAYVLEGGIFAPTEAPETEKVETMEELESQLLMANADLEVALRAKAQADVARRLEGPALDVATQEEQARLEERRQRLEAEAGHANEALEKAKAHKRELESKLRESEAAAANQRRQMEAEVSRRRAEAQARLRQEEARLQAEYREAATRIDAIKRAQHEAEERLRKEKERLEAEFAEVKRRMEDEARRIREQIQSAQRETEARANQIRTEHQSETAALRHELEERLKRERKRLESEFAETAAEQARARHDLDLSEDARKAIEAEAQKLADRIRAAEDRRRSAEEARLVEETERLEREAREARTRLESARRQMHEAAARTQPEGLPPSERAGEETTDMTGELAEAEARVAAATEAARAAEQASAEATETRTRTEVRHAAERAMETELREQLFQEMEQWLEADRMSEDAASKAQIEADMSAREAARRAEAEQKSKAAAALLDEVQAQLGAADDDTNPDLIPSAEVEPTSEDERRARAALERARARLEAQRKKGLED